MNENGINENIGAGEAAAEEHRPKPVKRLVRADRPRTSAAYTANGDQQQAQYHGAHEAPPSEQYHGAHEAPPSEQYHGAHEAPLSDNTDTAVLGAADEPDGAPHFYEPDYNDQGDYSRFVYQADQVVKKKKFSAKDALIKTLAILVSLVVIFALTLNMPIIRYTKTGQKMSVLNYLKAQTPLSYIEGELDKSDVNTNINPDVVNDGFTDGLDLPQLVEGQYSVLMLGFDESEELTDVVWVLEFDIAAAKLNILQIPRDTCLPDYTSSPTGKFNSIYQMGNPNVTPIQRVVNAVQENFGIPIDAYITTCCTDIEDMIDLVGGIPMTLDSQITYEADKIIPAGDIVLTGAQAEWFLRYRHGWVEGDIGRIKNQRRFMAAAMQKLMSIVADEGRLKLYGYLKKVYDNEWIATDMSVDDLSKLADFSSTLTMDNVRVNMVPGEGTPNDSPYIGPDGNAYSIYSVHKQATIDMLNEYYRPYQMPMTESDTALVEYITYYNYTVYDDTGDTLDNIEGSEAPKRNDYD